MARKFDSVRLTRNDDDTYTIHACNEGKTGMMYGDGVKSWNGSAEDQKAAFAKVSSLFDEMADDEDDAETDEDGEEIPSLEKMRAKGKRGGIAIVLSGKDDE